MSWDQIVYESPSDALTARILQAAEAQLAKRRSVEVPFWQRRLVILGGLTAAFAALIPATRILQRRSQSEVAQKEEQYPVESIEMLDNVELLDRLDLIGDYDVIAQWDGRDT